MVIGGWGGLPVVEGSRRRRGRVGELGCSFVVAVVVAVVLVLRSAGTESRSAGSFHVRSRCSLGLRMLDSVAAAGLKTRKRREAAAAAVRRILLDWAAAPAGRNYLVVLSSAPAAEVEVCCSSHSNCCTVEAVVARRSWEACSDSAFALLARARRVCEYSDASASVCKDPTKLPVEGGG